MYIAEVPNRNSRPTYLLRESYRENNRVKNRTLANLSSLPLSQIQLLKRVLKGEELVALDDVLTIKRSLPHGHVRAVLDAMKRLKVPELIASQPCRERDLIVGLVAQRVLRPRSKLGSARSWKETTLGEELGVVDADVDELYHAMDWLLTRKKRIENKLAKRHLAAGQHALYDVSSSSYTGRTCLLAQFGHNRDGRRDQPCIVYGVITDNEGRPVAVEVYPGNTGDPTTVPDQVDTLKKRFGLAYVVIVGDRGMLTQAQIRTIREREGIGWLSALRSESIRKLIEIGQIERSLFDEVNLAEIASPEFPGERLVACYNPLLADRRRRKREELLAATEEQFTRIAAEVARRTKTPLTQDKIGVKVGKVLNKHKVAKHFELTIDDSRFEWARKQESIDREAAMDGIYVIRTSEPADRLSAEEAVRGYKQLADVERAFRSLKGLDLLVRPLFHRLSDRVRAHVFICLLAYYVQWHLKQAWASLLFADEHLAEQRAQRDPVASAQPHPEVERKKRARHNEAGYELHSFSTLIEALATLTRQSCEFGKGESRCSFTKEAEATPLQAEAFRLLQEYCSQST